MSPSTSARATSDQLTNTVDSWRLSGGCGEQTKLNPCEWVTEWVGKWVSEWVGGQVSEWVSEWCILLLILFAYTKFSVLSNDWRNTH